MIKVPMIIIEAYKEHLKEELEITEKNLKIIDNELIILTERKNELKKEIEELEYEIRTQR